MEIVLVNPPATALGESNAVLWGRGHARYHTPEFTGPLSIKSMARGAGEWRSGGARYKVGADSYLLLNHGQPYELTIEAPAPVETLCVFFRRGYVEDAWRSMTTPQARLLDDPAPSRLPPFEVPETLHAADRAITPTLGRLRIALASSLPLEPLFSELASSLVRDHGAYAQAMARLPAVKRSTRAELYRRVQAGHRMLDDCIQSARLAQVAREACLSPFHFHRVFRAVYGETPHSYLTRRRLERAAKLLRETEQPVTLICLDSGFHSPGSFSALFRQRYGVSPRAFRENKQDPRSNGLAFGTE